MTTDAEQVPRLAGSDVAVWLDPGPDGAHLALEDFVSFRLNKAAAAVQRAIGRSYLAEFGLGPAHWRLLAMLARFSPLAFAEIVRRSSMDKAQISRAAQVLTQRGLIRRMSEGGRRVAFEVTPSGADLYDRVIRVARRHQRAMLDRLSPEQRRHLHAALTTLEAIATPANEPA